MSDAPRGNPPETLEKPTLGRAVRVGELYDQRSGKFLGVEIYPREKLKIEETILRDTKFTLSQASKYEDKTALLDISAELSLDVLGGIVKISGSASYVHDEKSNSQEYAYAMALKTRLKEKRLLFTEDELGRHVLYVALKDYITAGLATHFVSSVIYGGSYIVNLIARKSEYSEDDLIGGEVEGELAVVKKVVSLEAEASVDIKQKYAYLDDKFDLKVHGDVALDQVPITPKDVLSSFPNAAILLKNGGGVPISATLQPIPQKLHDVGLVYELDGVIVDKILTAFSLLDDLRSRFAVLQESVKQLQDFVPELVDTIRIVATEYTNKLTELLNELGTFLRDYQHGKRPDHGDLLNAVMDLYRKHIDPDMKDPDVSSKYPSTLVGLEVTFSRFEDLVSKVSAEKDIILSSIRSPTLNAELQRSFHLSSLRDIIKTITTQRKLPLFVMTPLDKGNPNLAISRYLAILRNYVWYFEDPKNPAFLFYGESLDDLEREFPNNDVFKNLEVPTAFLGTVDYQGNLTWHASPPVPAPSSDVSFPLSNHNTSGDPSLSLDPVDGRMAFTIQFQARRVSDKDTDVYVILTKADNSGAFMYFTSSYVILSSPKRIRLPLDKIPQPGDLFMVTFVQDTQIKEWIIYLNDDVSGRSQFVGEPNVADIQLTFLDMLNSWAGEVLGIKAFTHALSPDEVKALYLEWKK